MKQRPNLIKTKLLTTALALATLIGCKKEDNTTIECDCTVSVIYGGVTIDSTTNYGERCEITRGREANIYVNINRLLVSYGYEAQPDSVLQQYIHYNEACGEVFLNLYEKQ